MSGMQERKSSAPAQRRGINTRFGSAKSLTNRAMLHGIARFLLAAKRHKKHKTIEEVDSRNSSIHFVLFVPFCGYLFSLRRILSTPQSF